jgi:hypothetical protein
VYSSPNVIKIIKSKKVKRDGHVACMGDNRKAYRILMGNPEEKRSFGRPRHKWKLILKYI